MADVAYYDEPELIEGDEGYAPEPANDPLHLLIRNLKSPNLALDLDDSELGKIGSKVVEEYDIDLKSREEAGWDKRNEAALKLALQVREAKSFPWPNASNVK